MKLVETKAPQFYKMKFQEAVSGKHAPGIIGTLEGKFQHVDIVNGNKRRYSRKVFENALNKPKFQERLKNRGVVGELDHPEGGVTSYKRTSHVVTEATLGPDGVVDGKVEILDTPDGRILATLGKAGVMTGISSRGDGSVHEAEDGISEVNDDFELDTWDFVANPSTPGAFPQFRESIESNRIAEAFEALVDSTKDPRILHESYRIINELSAQSGSLTALREKISKKIKEDLEPKREEQQTMPNTAPAATVSPEVLDLATQMSESRVRQVHKQYGADRNKLLTQISEQSRALSESDKKLKAAEAIIEEFIFKNKTLHEKLDEAPDVVPDQQLEAKFGACKKLLEASLRVIDKLKMQGSKAEAAEKLCAAMVEVIRNGKKASHIERLLATEAKADELRPILESQPTIQKVNETFTKVKAMTGDTFTREPLPGQHVPQPSGRPLQESLGNRQGADAVMDGILAKVNGI